MRLYLFKIIVFFVPSMAFGWSYDQAYSMLVSNNAEYQNAIVASQSAKLSLSVAKSLLYPRLDLRAAADRFIQEDASSGYRAFIGPRISAPIYRGGYLLANKRAEEARLSQAELKVSVELLDKTQKLREAFANALYAKNYLSVARNILNRSEKNLRLVELKYQSGREYKWVYLTTKTDFEEDRLTVLQAKLDQQKALVSLQELVGELPVSDIQELDEDGFYTAEIPMDAFEHVDLTQHVEYRVETSTVAESQYKYDMNKSDRFPNISFRMDFVLIDTDDEPIIPFWSTGISMSMPLFAFNRYKNEQRMAALTQSQSELTRLQTLRKLQAEYQKAVNRFQIVQKKLEIAELRLEALQDRSRVTTEQYKNGLEDFVVWNRSQNALKSAETQILEQKKDWMIAYATLVRAAGKGL
ncbi:MAG: TolC family protein [Deltaproteobacteria bacterium]|nr:TolC family protein [Deltaproteobacteria bacterium]